MLGQVFCRTPFQQGPSHRRVLGSFHSSNLLPCHAADACKPLVDSLEEYSTATADVKVAAMKQMAKKLQLHKPGRHIFLCSDQTVAKCCTKESSLQSWDYLKKRCKELGLEQATESRGPVFRTKANCLRVCINGPIAVVYPDQVYYHSCTPTVLEQILQQHILGGKIVEEYQITVDS